MKVLVIGAGVIGTVYGAHLGPAATPSRSWHTGCGLPTSAGKGCARDVLADVLTESPAAVIDRADTEAFDPVLVALRRDHLPFAGAQLTMLSEQPLVL